MTRSMKRALALLVVLGSLVGAVYAVQARVRRSEPDGTAIAVPAYFPPGAGWTRVAEAAPAVGLAVLNPASGPGAEVESGYADAVRQAQAGGIAVLGYVPTGYGAHPVADVLAEVRAYYA